MSTPTRATGLEIANLRFAFADWQVHFDLSLPAGSLLAIIGPSGSGKSTLLNLIAGFETPMTGSIQFAGEDITHRAPADRPITMLFQDNNVFAHLDVETNVALGIAPNLKLTPQDRSRIADAHNRVGLTGKQHRLPGQLSGGERQRVALARAVVRARPLLLLDEPFAALGPALKADMLGLVCEIRAENAMTVLFVTHNPEDARRAASHTAFLNNGTIEAMAPTAELFARTDLPALAAYLG
jgi:thiamine transport system ATP-binding protein